MYAMFLHPWKMAFINEIIIARYQITIRMQLQERPIQVILFLDGLEEKEAATDEHQQQGKFNKMC